MIRTITGIKANEVCPKTLKLLTMKGSTTHPDLEVTFKKFPTVVIKVQTVARFIPGHSLPRDEHIALVRHLNLPQ